MLCKDLKPGMLVIIDRPDKRGWFNITAHERAQKRWPGVPPRFTIGPDVISLLMRFEGVESFIRPGEVFVYVGKKKIFSKKGKFKSFRIVLANGHLGYLEGRDARYLKPA